MSLPSEYKRRTRSTDPIGPDEDVVTVVDPRDVVWKDDIVDPNKKPNKLDRKKLANKTDQNQKAKTSDQKKPANKTDQNQKAKTSDQKKPANKTDQNQKAKTLDRKKLANLANQNAISAAVTVTTSTITTVPALMNGGSGDGGDDESMDVEGISRQIEDIRDNDPDDDTFDSNETRTDDDGDDNGDPQSQSSGDTAIHRAMKEAKVDSFKDIDDVNRIIDAYESLTENGLRI